MSIFAVLDGRKLFGQAKPYNGYGVRKAEELLYKEIEKLGKIKDMKFHDYEVILTDLDGQSIAFSMDW
jgi:hypothetical protein